MIFIDTSALYALADRTQQQHARAADLFDQAGSAGETFLTHNYVLSETIALIEHRLGRKLALRVAESSHFFAIEWITADIHDQALARLRRSRNRGAGFIDQVSFLVMRKHRVDTAFAFDRDFVHEGLKLWS